MKDKWGREVIVETLGYENRLGKKPRGYGMWAFHFGGYAYGEPLEVHFKYEGGYSDAKKAAIKECARWNRCGVVVCP